MNFEEIKKEMDAAVSEESKQPAQIDLTKGKNNPIAAIRKNMKREIIIQLICIVIFMVYPVFVDMYQLNEAVYYIFMFITSIMTLSYIIKLTYFLKHTSNFAATTKDAIREFIYEAQLTLEVYKSFIIAGSLLLPLPVFALITNRTWDGDIIFERWFLLEISGTELSLLIVGYLIAAFIFYYGTKYWAKLLYGKYLNELEEISSELSEF